MVGMGYRTLKTAVGAGLAIWIASLLDLEFATFAAIIVIMCIEKTKKKTLNTIQKKFFASLLSLFLGAVFFEVFGYNPIVFSFFILLFVPILVKARIQAGFVTSMVVVLHIYTVKDANLDIFLNELYIIFIGMGIALLVNSFMPNFKRDIETFKKKIEHKFSAILYEFSAYLRDSERNWNGKEILEVEEIINQAKSIAIQDVENHILRKLNKDYYYLEMREDQLELLKHMVKIVAIVSSSDLHVEQKEMFAEFLAYLSQNVHSGDTTDSSLHKLEECMASIRETELPKTREEFEIRANLFYLIFEIENYLNIKKKLFSRRS
ncbi:aromatic acid exporter family protein [Oceanobacillus zhaokaii]|nr:aromatic acid exporter family protein [Oceanobacillus zhaokaii]